MHSLLRLMKLSVVPHGVLFRERRPGLIILVYHRVGGRTDSDIDLPIDLFARQMAYLHGHYLPISLEEVAHSGFPRDGSTTDRVAVTFDDGCREVYEHAYPVLRRYGIPATVYLATRYVDGQTPFDFGGYRRTRLSVHPLTWSQVHEMATSGLVNVGAHTHSHADLTQLSREQVRQEVLRSRACIEDRIGRPVLHFSYPWGVLNDTVKAIVGEHFRTAVRGGCAKNPFGALDLLALWRRPVQQADGFWMYRLKLASYLDGEEYLRRLAQAVQFDRHRRDAA